MYISYSGQRQTTGPITYVTRSEFWIFAPSGTFSQSGSHILLQHRQYFLTQRDFEPCSWPESSSKWRSPPLEYISVIWKESGWVRLRLSYTVSSLSPPSPLSLPPPPHNYYPHWQATKPPPTTKGLAATFESLPFKETHTQTQVYTAPPIVSHTHTTKPNTFSHIRTLGDRIKGIIGFLWQRRHIPRPASIEMLLTCHLKALSGNLVYVNTELLCNRSCIAFW